jgi:hypothetical protein
MTVASRSTPTSSSARSDANRPLAIVNPRQIRDFARRPVARLDAQMIALFCRLSAHQRLDSTGQLAAVAAHHEVDNTPTRGPDQRPFASRSILNRQ